ncbi:hypothetical protein GYMLUDRAFT_162371, partial [Collybiopsis luxurians FD-317 M1]
IGLQSFPLTLDTGSSDLWVISNECQSLDCLSVARYSTSFSSKLSISQTPFHIEYISGSVSGLAASEIITLGPYQLYSQVFGLANSTQNIHFASEGNSGILGLAFPAEASMSGMTVLQSIFSVLVNPYFTIALDARLDSNSSPSFTLGEIDSSLAKDLSDFFPIPVSRVGANDYTYWKIPLLYLTINSTRLSLSPSSVQNVQNYQIAITDTGMTLMLGPTRDVQALWTSVGSAARNDPVTGMWQVRCDKAILLGLVLGQKDSHQEFLLDPADISWKKGGFSNGWCLGGIQATDEAHISVESFCSSLIRIYQVDSGDWLLGDVFLRNVYSLYHAANSSSGPWVGLISRTNESAALSAFRQNRGPDRSHSSSMQILDGTVTTPEVRSKLLFSMCGLLVGAILTTLFRARRGLLSTFARRNRKL